MGEKKRKVMGFVRVAHIYLTLFALMLFIFFSATGFMLNHSDWFGIDDIRTESVEGDFSSDVMVPLDRLAIVESLRTTYGASGAVEAFEIEDEEVRVIFKRPARRTEAVITRPSGHVSCRPLWYAPAACVRTLLRSAAFNQYSRDCQYSKDSL